MEVAVGGDGASACIDYVKKGAESFKNRNGGLF